MNKTINTHKHHNGFTLIEILITVVVVSIGLLGLAGLQINGLRANMGSEARSIATLKANDIAERMRANQLGINQYASIATAGQNCESQPAPFCSNYNTGTVTTEEEDGTTITVTVAADGTVTTVTAAADGAETTETTTADDTTSTMSSATDCTPADMAAFDAWVWACGLPVATGVQRGGVTNQLLNGAGNVVCAGGTCTITVTWDALNQDRSGDATTAATISHSYSLVLVP